MRDETRERVLSIIKPGEWVGNYEVAARAKRDPTWANWYMNELTREGRLEKKRAGRGFHYCLKNEPQGPSAPVFSKLLAVLNSKPKGIGTPEEIYEFLKSCNWKGKGLSEQEIFKAVSQQVMAAKGGRVRIRSWRALTDALAIMGHLK